MSVELFLEFYIYTVRREAPACSAAIGIGVKTSSNVRPGGIRERGHHEIVAAGLLLSNWQKEKCFADRSSFITRICTNCHVYFRQNTRQNKTIRTIPFKNILRYKELHQKTFVVPQGQFNNRLNLPRSTKPNYSDGNMGGNNKCVTAQRSIYFLNIYCWRCAHKVIRHTMGNGWSISNEFRHHAGLSSANNGLRPVLYIIIIICINKQQAFDEMK